MRVLHVIIKREWFNLIASGEKKEEYREIKPYWMEKLLSSYSVSMKPNSKLLKSGTLREFDVVLFQNGYRDDAPKMYVEFKGVHIGKPNPRWSDGSVPEECFVIQLGRILKWWEVKGSAPLDNKGRPLSRPRLS